MAGRVTIRDIAKIANCSANCVSRALMDAPDISQKTKQKIRMVADELGYVYNRNAAALRRGKSRTIGILFDSLLNPFYYIMTNYIWERLHSEGYNIITLKNDHAIFNEDMARQIASVNVDGLLSFLQPEPEAQSLLDVSGMPDVVIGRKTHGMCDCVVLDDAKGGRLAAENFISRGFKKPLYLGETDMLDCSVERGRGFSAAFEEAGIKAEVKFLCSFELYKFASYFNKLYQEGNLPDCIFCFSDHAAYEVMSEMDRLGIKDIAVIGFDDIQKEIFLPGTLTTISYDKRKMAGVAVEILLNKINDIPDNHSQVTFISDMSVSYTKPILLDR